MEIDFDEAFRRIDDIVGDADGATAVELWLQHLRQNLVLPCEVTGVEDFRWEEPYLLGVGDPAEYRRLCRRQPSYRDVFSLKRIESSAADSEWALFGDDLGAYVTRSGDGRSFVLGLSELQAVDHADNARLLQDYSIWHANYR